MFKEVSLVYFSSTKTTQRTVRAIGRALAKAFDIPVQEYDFTLPNARSRKLHFTSDQLVIVGSPVYGGVMPLLVREYLAQYVTGEKTACVLAVIYGNRNFDDCLVEMQDLMEENGFEAVFVGSGAGLPMFMHIPGEELKGVCSANEYLTRINLMKAYKDGSDTPIMPLQGKKVAVVGGGNVAMDAARCSKRLGADVYVVYRRGMEELPARHEEVEHAIEEGIVFKTLNNPVKINGDEKGYVSSMTCVEMELGEPDASGRRRPIEKVGSEHDLPVDCVIMSLGTTPNPLIKNTTPGLEVNRKGGIVVNEAGLTSHQNVYAGGDAVTGAATVILAMGAGKLGAKSIDEALSK